jgi:putative transposase
MVSHPAQYPWSSYQINALGKQSTMLTPHAAYLALGDCAGTRQQAYRHLFAQQIPELTLQEIRNAANKSWVLGNNRFKQLIEQQLGYELPPFTRGGDRKSVEFSVGKIKLL